MVSNETLDGENLTRSHSPSTVIIIFIVSALIFLLERISVIAAPVSPSAERFVLSAMYSRSALDMAQ